MNSRLAYGFLSGFSGQGGEEGAVHHTYRENSTSAATAAAASDDWNEFPGKCRAVLRHARHDDGVRATREMKTFLPLGKTIN